MELYTPVLALAALAAGFAVFSVVVSSLTGSGARQPRQAGLLRVRHRAHAPARRRGSFPGAVLHHRDDVHHLRHRDRLSLPIAVAFDQMALFGLIEMVLFIIPVFVAYTYVWKRGGLEWD